MNGIIDVLFITIVTIMLTGILTLLFKALECHFGDYVRLSFYYRFLCLIILLYGFSFLFVLFRLGYYIITGSATPLLGMATPIIRYIFSFFAAAWFVGMVVMFIKQKDSIRFLLKLYKERILVTQDYCEVLDELCKEMGIHRRIPIYRSKCVSTVFICGLIRPAIYLPENMTDVYLKTAFMHELRHYKQGDIPIKFISGVLRCVYWFWKPFTYIADEYSIYAEASNDEYCVRKTGDGKKYFNMLLEFSDICGNAGAILPAWVEKSNDIARRLTLVNIYRKEKMRASVIALFIAFTLVVSCGTAYGATEAIQYGYNQLWHGTMSGVEEEPDVLPELEEYEGTMADFEGMTEVQGEDVGITPLAGGGFISCTLMNQCYYRSPAFSKTKGGTIEVLVSVKPTDKEVTVGIIKPGGTTTYVKGKKAISHTFSVPTTGSYQVFISNYSGAQVTIKGNYE